MSVARTEPGVCSMQPETFRGIRETLAIGEVLPEEDVAVCTNI